MLNDLLLWGSCFLAGWGMGQNRPGVTAFFLGLAAFWRVAHGIRNPAREESFPVPSTEPEPDLDQCSPEEVRRLAWMWQRKSLSLSTTLLRIKHLCRSLDRDEIIATLLEVVAKGLEAERIQFLVADEKTRVLRIIRAEGMTPAEYASLTIPYDDRCLVACLANQADERPEAPPCFGKKEFEQDDRFRGFIGQGPIQTILAAPILVGDKLFGILNIEKMKNPEYTRADWSLMALTAEIAGSALHHSHLHFEASQNAETAQRGMVAQQNSNAELQQSLSRIIPPELAGAILAEPGSLRPGCREAQATLLALTIIDTAEDAATLPPKETFTFLNRVFEVLTATLPAFEGTLDRFLPDGLCVLFGQPLPRDDHPLRAVACAWRMIETLRTASKSTRHDRIAKAEIKIGIATGDVAVGYLGSENQLSWTAIGPAAHSSLALRRQARGLEILISPETAERVRDCFRLEKVETCLDEGRAPVEAAFRVTGLVDSEVIERLVSSRPPLPSAPIPTVPPPVPAPGRSLITCANCGRENDSQTKFCSVCGMPIF